ncbi:unnamed protein product [Gemmataceae bacterium]|nr:unnamed protein product [Gemmataceae bacterium]VTT98989.1 unnamed protein product [Gemmataceae bacterium]
MSARRTGTASVAVLLATALGAVAVDATLGLDAARDDARQHEADAAVIEDQRVRVIRENEFAGRVVARLIAGEVSLAAAVDAMEPIHRARPGIECAWMNDPPPTFRHRVARSVMIRVGAELEGDPSRRAAILTRLDAEYATLR